MHWCRIILSFILTSLIISSNVFCKNESPKPFIPIQKNESKKFGIQEGYYSIFGTIDDADQLFENIGDLPVKNYRHMIFWNMVEQTDGDFNWTRHDQLINMIRNKGLDLFIQIYGGNKIHDPDYAATNIEHPPYSGEYLQKWLRFVEQAVRRYGDRVKRWEIWNEPDLIENGEGVFWKPMPSPENFSQLIKETALKIKSIQPNAEIIMGGVTVFNGYKSFLRECFNRGVLNYVDGVGLHPYRTLPEGGFNGINPDPESVSTFDLEIVNLKNLIDSYKKGIKIWDTESGYINFDFPLERDHAQAKYISRSMLIEYAAGLKGLTYFRLRTVQQNDFNILDPGQAQALYDNQKIFMGLIDQYGGACIERPAFNAFKEVAKYFSDASVQYVESIEFMLSSGEKVRIEKYLKHRQPLIAYWIIESIDNIEKPVRYREIVINDVNFHSFKIADIVHSTTLDPGECLISGSDLMFNNLPITDYPFLLFIE